MRALAILTLLVPLAPARQEAFVVARSPTGAALAIARPAERQRSGWELVVAELRDGREKPLWKAPWSPRPLGGEEGWAAFLTDDGDALALVLPRWSSDDAQVEIWRRGQRLATVDADRLGIREDEPVLDKQGRWILLDWDTARLRTVETGRVRTHALDLLGLDGELRTIDLSNGWVELSQSAELGFLDRPLIAPGVPEELAGKVDTPFVHKVRAPATGVAGEPLEIEIEGTFPTPGQTIVGYTIEAEAPSPDSADGATDSGLTLVVRPWAAMLPGGPAAQFITRFNTKAAIVVPTAGRHRLTVAGRDGSDEIEPLELLLAPRRTLVTLEISGGIAGGRERFEVLRDSRWRLGGRTRLASLPLFAEIVAAESGLPDESKRAQISFGSDLLLYRIEWVREGRPLSAELNDLSLQGPWKRLVSAVTALRSDRSPTPPTWTLVASEGRLVVKTRSTGLLKGLGHDHEISATERSATLVFDPASPVEARLELSVGAASLVPLAEEDRDEIQGTMRSDVLEVARFPRIAFTSRRVDLKEIAPERWEAVLHGVLSLHGVERPLVVGARIALVGEELLASGRFKLRLSEHGMKPPSAALGTINVADDVEIEFDLVLRRTAR